MFPEKKIRAKNIIFLIILFSFNAAFGSEVDSLKYLLTKENSDKIKAEIHESIGDIHLRNRAYDLALNNFQKALDLTPLNTSKTIILSKVGKTHNEAQNYPKAIEIFKKLTRDFLPENPKILADIYFEISRAYRRLGNNELAYEYQLQALEQHKTSKDSSNIARSLYEIGGIFFYQKNLEVAIDYYKQSEKICKKLNLKRGIYNCQAAIGGAYSRMLDTENSLKYNLKAYELARELDYETGLAYSTHNLGVNYLAKEELATALEYFLESLKLKEKQKDKWGSVSTLRNLGDAYRLKNQPEKSLEYLNRALAVSEELGSKPRLYEVWVSFADHYNAFGNYEKATQALYKSLALKDTLVNEATLEKMSDAKSRFELREKETVLEQKDRELNAMYQWIYVVSISALIILFWLLYSKYKAQKAHNLALENKNHQIQAQNEQLALANDIQLKNNQKISEQNKQLEISNSQLQRFAFIASHDLKEPLRTIGSYSNLLQRRYKNQLDENADDFLKFIGSGVKRMYHLLNDVLDYSKVGTGEEEREWVETSQITEEIILDLKDRIQKKEANIVLGELPNVRANPAHMRQIFQNLISNALKFTNGKVPVIEINGTKKNNLVQFEVKDNGIGMDMKYDRKIFEIFQRLHGKHEFEGTGVGLAICKKITEHYDGEIWVESKLNEGSTFYFTLKTESDSEKKIQKELVLSEEQF